MFIFFIASSYLLVQIQKTVFIKKQVIELEKGYERLLVYHQIKKLNYEDILIPHPSIEYWKINESFYELEEKLIRHIEIIGEDVFIVEVVYDKETKTILEYR